MLASQAVRELLATEPKWGPVGPQIYDRTYSRPTATPAVKENWFETIERTVFGNVALVPKKYLEPNEAEQLLELFYYFNSLPAGRHLWASGVPGRQFLFNCHHSGWTKLLQEHCAFTFDELMKGGGTGTNFSNRYINVLPKIMRKLDLHVVCNPGHRDYQKVKHLLSSKVSHEFLGADRLEDSREGWVHALSALIARAVASIDSPEPLVFDVSLIRPEGELIKGFGGTASGPKPLVELLFKFNELLGQNAGQKMGTMPLMYAEHYKAECVVAGNVRRSARMSIKSYLDPDIMDFVTCKDKDRELWSTNISVEYDHAFIRKIMRGEEHSNKVLNAVIRGMLLNGEPGLWNYTLSQKGEIEEVSSTNPCQPGYATILTPSGIRTLSEIKEGDTVWSGARWTKVTKKWSTGVKPVYKYTTSTGVFIGTENHRVVQNGEKIEVSEAETIDWCKGRPFIGIVHIDPQAIMDGLVIGDGSVHKASNNLVFLCIGEHDQDYFKSEIKGLILEKRSGLKETAYEIKTTITPEELPRTWLRTIPDRFFKGDVSTVVCFLKGLFSANGSAVGNRVTLKQSSRPMIEQVQQMLSFLGISSYITTNKAHMVEFRNGQYECKESYDLNIGTDRGRFFGLIGFLQDYKQAKVSSGIGEAKHLSSTVQSREFLEETEVFDMTVDDVDHTYWTGGCLVSNCGEIPLLPFENCNLGHVNLGAYWNKPYKAMRAFRLMARYLVRATYGDITNPFQRDVVNRNRRIGVGFFGYQSFCAKQGIKYSESYLNPHIRKFLQEAYQTVRKSADEYAFQLRIPAPIKCTTVAPTGTIAKLPGETEGMQPIQFCYGLRGVNYSTTDPSQVAQIAAFKKKGYPMEMSVYSPNTMFVQFPYKDKLVDEVEALGLNPDELVESAYDIKLQDYLEVQSMIQDTYADNSISVTINQPQTAGTKVVMEGESQRVVVENEKIFQEQCATFKSTLVHYLHRVKGVTVMPGAVRTQMPYQALTKEEFLKTQTLAEVGQGAMECNGACPIK